MIRFILVGTTHPGNIGASARAMKNMGFLELCLVSPKRFPDPEATARASGATDVLEAALVYDTLAEAVADCGLVAATSARQRFPAWPVVEPREAARHLAEQAESQPAAIVFGRESSGLSNEELRLCNLLVQIPTHPTYRSLNVAMAVQILAYELWLARETGTLVPGENPALAATAEERRMFFAHLERVLLQTRFLDPERPRYLMEKLRRLFNRADPDQNEMNILRGILASIETRIGEGEA